MQTNCIALLFLVIIGSGVNGKPPFEHRLESESLTGEDQEILQDQPSSAICMYLIKDGYFVTKGPSPRWKLCPATLSKYYPSCIPEALGMENGDIPDSSITASSYQESIYRPEQGRLHYKGDGKSKHPAWEAANNEQGTHWFQVDLGRKMKVTKVATQGNGKATINEWVTAYTLQYSNDGKTFTPYKNDYYGDEFYGNEDKDSVQENTIDPPIQARYVRLLPVSWHFWPALRMELYGCPLDSGNCIERPLGMESGAIPDESITASSYYHSMSPPQEARLNNRKTSLLAPSAWRVVFDKPGSWIQVDLDHVTTVSGLATQGLPDDGVDFTKSYKLAYSNDGVAFNEYLNGKLLDGNTDTDSVVKHDLRPVIKARYIRIYPQSWKGLVAMRFELYGCKTERSMSSLGPKKDKRAPSVYQEGKPEKKRKGLSREQYLAHSRTLFEMLDGEDVPDRDR